MIDGASGVGLQRPSLAAYLGSKNRQRHPARSEHTRPGCGNNRPATGSGHHSHSRRTRHLMSSSLCTGCPIFPLQVEAMKDRVDNAVHAFDIHKADHRPGPSPDLDERGAQLTSQMAREAEERQQLRHFAVPSSDSRRATPDGSGRTPAALVPDSRPGRSPGRLV